MENNCRNWEIEHEGEKIWRNEEQSEKRIREIGGRYENWTKLVRI